MPRDGCPVAAKCKLCKRRICNSLSSADLWPRPNDPHSKLTPLADSVLAHWNRLALLCAPIERAPRTSASRTPCCSEAAFEKQDNNLSAAMEGRTTFMSLHGQAAFVAGFMLLLVSPVPAGAFTCYGCSNCGLYSCSACSSTSYGDACSSTGYSYTYSCGGKLTVGLHLTEREGSVPYCHSN